MDFLNEELPEQQAVENIIPEQTVDQAAQEPVPEQPEELVAEEKAQTVKEMPEKENWKKRLFKDAKDVLYMLAIFMLVYIFCFRTVVVVGDSMYDTLINGDRLLLVSNILYHQPERGDIIVASKKAFRDGECIIKRVIATEGLEVDIDFETGTVYVNGEALPEPYLHSPTVDPEGMVFPLTVPDGCLFPKAVLYPPAQRRPHDGGMSLARLVYAGLDKTWANGLTLNWPQYKKGPVQTGSEYQGRWVQSRLRCEA